MTIPMPEELNTCPRCRENFTCSKSGKCWCFEIDISPEKLEEIESLYEGCLCPECMDEYARQTRSSTSQ